MLPADELVPAPTASVTRAVSVLAPAEDVWAWLVQIGQDRGGLHSYDVVENLLGMEIHSRGGLREEWQRLTVGDRVQLVPKGWLGMKNGVSLRVARLEPGRALVLREQPPELPWDAVWSFHVVPTGSDRCRLISRSRVARRRGFARLAGELMDPATLVVTRKILLGIKLRAEDRYRVATLAA